MKKFKFTIRGNQYDVEVQSFEDSIAKVEVNGTCYSIEVHKEVKQPKTPVLVRTQVPQPSRSESKIKKSIGSGAQQIKAPLPGNIMQIFVSPGDSIKKGEKLLMYEAMKMENTILAEKDGSVAAIKVQAGDSVLEGDVLIELS